METGCKLLVRIARLDYSGRSPKADDAIPAIPPVTRNEPTFTDLGLVDAPGIGPQDHMAWVGQGPISDRTREHLVTSDKGVVLYHDLLLEQIDRVERGEDPLGVIRDPAVNEPFIPIKHEENGYQAFRINREVTLPRP